MPVVVIGNTVVAARLLRYTEKEKRGGTEPRVLYSEGILCRVPTAEREFAALRRKHGKQGARRKAPARYALPEQGEVATHIRRTRPNGRRYWGPAADAEAATHVRRDPGQYVGELQAVHYIVSFGLDEVHPDDPDQVRRSFEFVTDMMRSLYPGVMMKLVGQADGQGRAFHVHCVANAVVADTMTVDGHTWRAGRKLSGALTDVSRVRERLDGFIRENGDAYGVRQSLPTVTEQRAEKRTARDRRMARQGTRSNHDLIRAAFAASIGDPRSVDLDAFTRVMQEHGITVKHRVTRRGKPREAHALSFVIDGMAMPVRGATLGDYFTYESAMALLGAVATGRTPLPRPGQARPGTPRGRTQVTVPELAEATALMEFLAKKEKAARAADAGAGSTSTSRPRARDAEPVAQDTLAVAPPARVVGSEESPAMRSLREFVEAERARRHGAADDVRALTTGAAGSDNAVLPSKVANSTRSLDAPALVSKDTETLEAPESTVAHAKSSNDQVSKLRTQAVDARRRKMLRIRAELGLNEERTEERTFDAGPSV